MRKFNVEFGLGLNFLIPFAREVVVFEADITASIHLEPTLIFLFHASIKKSINHSANSQTTNTVKLSPSYSNVLVV